MASLTLGAYPAAASARFFLISRLSSSTRGESSASLAFIRKPSRPPRWSMVLRAFADTRSFTERPSASDITVTLSRLGRNRRLVLRFEWLTLCPTCAALPVSSHRRDMAQSSLDVRGLAGHAASGRLQWRLRSELGKETADV